MLCRDYPVNEKSRPSIVPLYIRGRGRFPFYSRTGGGVHRVLSLPSRGDYRVHRMPIYGKDKNIMFDEVFFVLPKSRVQVSQQTCLSTSFFAFARGALKIPTYS